MKQLFSVILITGIMVLMTGTLVAQKSSANLFAEITIASPTSVQSMLPEEINPRAKTIFENEFKNASNVKWLQLKDGQLAGFKENETRYSVYFYDNGNKAGLIKGYTVDKLDKEIKETVEYGYPGYKITYVNECSITGNGNVPVYEINLKGEKDIKVIQFYEGETAVILDSSKPGRAERF
jgi:hypothetical protein